MNFLNIADLLSKSASVIKDSAHTINRIVTDAFVDELNIAADAVRRTVLNISDKVDVVTEVATMGQQAAATKEEQEKFNREQEGA